METRNREELCFFWSLTFWSVFLIFGDIFRFGYDYDTPSSFEMPRMPETMECFLFVFI